MKHILIPTDFSNCALSALKVGAAIAHKTGASLSLVHTYTIPVYGFTSGQLMYDGPALTKMTDEISDELHQIAGMPELEGLVVKKLLLSDATVEQMLHHDDLQDVDLIVMGTHGTSNLGQDILGSNAERMIRHARVPVLCVREGHEENFEIKNIVFASSFFGEVEATFPSVKKMADLLGARVHLLNVITPGHFQTTAVANRQMNDFVEKFELKDATTNIYNEYTVEEGVLRFARDKSCDMIAMETHGRKGIAHLFLGSITEDVANHTDLPLLSIRIKEYPAPKGAIFPEMR